MVKRALLGAFAQVHFGLMQVKVVGPILFRPRALPSKQEGPLRPGLISAGCIVLYIRWPHRTEVSLQLHQAAAGRAQSPHGRRET